MTPLNTGKSRRERTATPSAAHGALSAGDQALAFAALVDNSEDLVALVDAEGRLLYLNGAGREMVGLEQDEGVEGRSLCDFLPPKDADRLRHVVLGAVIGDGQWQGEGQLRNCRTGRLVDVLVNSFLIHQATPARPLCIATVQRDITDRKRHEQSIRASEERFRQLAENIEAVFWVSEVDPRKVLYVSPAFEAVFGAKVRELYADADTYLRNIHPDDRQRIIDSLPKARLGGYDETFRIMRPDGSMRTIRSRAFPVRNEQGDVYRVAGIAQDITEGKRAEEELLAEQRFLEHLLSVQEGERKLIAYDIHDGFLQAVIASVMHLEGLGADSATLDSTRDKLKLPLNLLRGAIEEARRMISGLRPPILDEQGLVAAIRFLISENRDARTKIVFHHTGNLERFEPVLEGTLFRIVQEALSNIARHSQAETAQISLDHSAGALRLVIEDTGLGFDPHKATGRQFGLRGIRERARLFGGTATIDSKPGAGTRILVELPLRPDFEPTARSEP
jgi:PAS domain S-box-containing protein